MKRSTHFTGWFTRVDLKIVAALGVLAVGWSAASARADLLTTNAGVTVTASAFQATPMNLVDGIGITWDTPTTSPNTDQNDWAGWVSASQPTHDGLPAESLWGNYVHPSSEWLVFDLGSANSLTSMVVYNSIMRPHPARRRFRLARRRRW